MRFGRYPEGQQVKQYWGARAIFCKSTGYKIDIPYDRKTFEGNRDTAQPFIDWVNNEFFPWLNKQVNLSLFYDQDKVIRYSSGGYHGEASCQGSYGYLYIGCWEE